MAFTAPPPAFASSNNADIPEFINEFSSLLSTTPSDGMTGSIFDILDEYAVTLDTQSYPAILYAESILYMVYWFHRLRDPARKSAIENNLGKYLNVDPQSPVLNALLSDETLKIQAKQRIDQGVMVRKTVDILVMRDGPGGREFLTLDRRFFPEGMALPGGLVHDDDDHNDIGIPGDIFAALRVTGGKVFKSTGLQYGIAESEARKYYFVRSDAEQEARIHLDRTIAHGYRDHLKEIAIPSDPRHIVDTVGFMVEISNTEGIEGRWIPESMITTPNPKEGSFAFVHHKQIVAALIAKNFTKTQGMSHHEWIRETVKNPLESYREIRARFKSNSDDINTPILELLPVVEYFRSQMKYSRDRRKVLQ